MAAPSGIYRVSGSRPRLPTTITLFTDAMSALRAEQFTPSRAQRRDQTSRLQKKIQRVGRAGNDKVRHRQCRSSGTLRLKHGDAEAGDAKHQPVVATVS